MFKRVFYKLTSFKNLLAVWAVVLVTYIVVNNRVDFNNVSMTLVGVIVAYFPVNLIQKRNSQQTKDPS